LDGRGSGATPLTRTYDTPVPVTLTAPATFGANTFRLWSGCTSSSGTTCVVTLTGSTTVRANYRDPSHSLATCTRENTAYIWIEAETPAGVHGF
jgi:hypothetical protein